MIITPHSNNKTLFANDGIDTKDRTKIKRHRLGDTDIEIRIPETGELVFKGKNKVILPGAGFLARAMFDLPSSTEITPSYNTKLDLENSVYETPDALNTTILFAVGIGGCGRENSQIYDVDYAKWITPEELVPFRYCLSNEDISDSLREVYFGRKTIGDRIAYYFKAFENNPTLVQQYVDGTPINADVYDSSKQEEIETYVDIRLSVTKEDCREFFLATTGINDARINSISLLTAWPKYFEDPSTRKQYKYFQSVRPITRLNFSNESLIDLSKGLDIIYHIYF